MGFVNFFKKNKTKGKGLATGQCVADGKPASGNENLQRELVDLLKSGFFERAIPILASVSSDEISYECHMEIGNLLVSGGYLNDALVIFKAAMANSNTPEAVDSIAKCYLALNRAKDAKEIILFEGYQAKPLCMNTLLHAHVVLGDVTEAVKTLFRLADEEVANAELFFFIAQQLYVQNLYIEAIVVLERAIDDGIVSESIYLLAANAYEATEDLDESDYCFVTAIEDFGRSKGASHEYVNFLFRVGKYSQAKDNMLNLLKEFPDDFALLNDFGSGLYSLGDIDEAIDCFEKCIFLYPNSSVALNNFSVILREAGEFEKARLLIQKALKVVENCEKPDIQNSIDVEDIEVNQAMIDFDLGKHKGIEAQLTKKLEKCPDDHRVGWYRCLSRLVLGDFEGGWSDYEYRWKAENVLKRPFKFTEWNGEEGVGQSKKLLVFGEQGLGDEIMFASCLNELKQIESGVILECHPKLAKIFARSFPSIVVVGKSQLDSIEWAKDYDEIIYQIPVGSLPRFYRPKRERFLDKTPYLVAEGTRVDFWKTELDKLGDGLKIGISWRGGSKNTRTNLRSLKLDDLEPLLEMENIEWVNIQYGDVNEELKEIHQERNIKIHHFSEAIEDYDETASLVSALDCIVSVQTAVVHLAGALGVEVHCLLPSAPEWRYRMGDAGSGKEKKMLWYESVNLYSQLEKGDWSDVINRIRKQILKKQNLE